jgi:hypothetical protein
MDTASYAADRATGTARGLRNRTVGTAYSGTDRAGATDHGGGSDGYTTAAPNAPGSDQSALFGS